jgi:hypothetical protein
MSGTRQRMVPLVSSHITKTGQEPSVGSFSANVGLGALIFLLNVGTKERCYRAGRFMLSGCYTYVCHPNQP